MRLIQRWITLSSRWTQLPLTLSSLRRRTLDSTSYPSLRGERRAYVTAELSWDDEPIVFVDIYSVDADGGERWVCGDMSIDAAVLYIADA